MEIKGKKLLILGGSRISGEIVRKARAMGIFTGVVDWYPLEASPAKQIADAWHIESTAKTDDVARLIRAKGYDGVITGFTDSVLPYYAEICGKAGIPCYGTKAQFELLTNKRRYKNLCREFGVPVAEEYDLSEETPDEALCAVPLPVLIKPADSSGGRGITVCRRAEDLKAACQRARAFSASGEILAERFLTGQEMTVFWLIRNGEVFLSGTADRHMSRGTDGTIGLPVGYAFPSIHTDAYVREVRPRAEAMLRSLGLQNGVMFMQCFVEDGRCILYDIGFRLTGTLEYKLQQAICGYDPLEMLIRFALTGEMGGPPYITPDWPRFGLNLSYLIRPGTVGTIDGLEALPHIKGYVDAQPFILPGEVLEESQRGTLSQIALRAFGAADDREGLIELTAAFHQHIDIRSVGGESLLLERLGASDLEGRVT